MHDLIYSTQESGFDPNIRYENPQYFNGRITPSDGVLVIGDWPDVVKAYEAAGIAVKVQASATGAKNAHVEDGPYPDMTDDDLRKRIEDATGEKPHHKTGRAKLVEQVSEFMKDNGQ